MSKLKEFLGRLTVKQIVFSSIAAVSLFLCLILTLWINGKVAALPDQQAARRWDEKGSYAQVSCFFKDGVEIDDFALKSFERQLTQMIGEVLPSEETAEENGNRLFISAYSTQGRITIQSERTTLETNAVGVGGDFFLFHPLQLLSGSYFSGDDLMQDAVVLDETAAWQLFGSSDIAGMSVTIGGVPHYIAGVVKRPEGKFAEKSGLDQTIVFVSYDTLKQYGGGGSIGSYEITAPNPVKRFLYMAVKEKLGVEETDMVVVENSYRYSTEALIGIILDFGMRSMQDVAVSYPYWENIARGWEDVSALIMLLRLIFLLIPVVIIVIFVIIKWRNRTFTGKDVLNSIIGLKERAVQRFHGEKNKWKHF